MGVRRNHPQSDPARTRRPDRDDAEAEKRVRKTLKLANALNKNVVFHRWPTNRVWTRDSGCTFVAEFQRSECYVWPSWASAGTCPSNQVALHTRGPNIRITGTTRRSGRSWRKPRARRKSALPTARLAVVLEGGSIDVNGAGHSAHHRRMPPEQGPAAKPWLSTAKTTNRSLPPISALRR